MCRYALHAYKLRYVCLDCRKAFKRSYRVDPEVLAKAGVPEPKPAVCPQCRRPMHCVGWDFKAPKQSDVKQWKKVELLIAHGFGWYSCGCNGPGLLPQDLRELDDFLRDRLPPTEADAFLAKIAARADDRRRARRSRPAGVAEHLGGRTWGPVRSLSPRFYAARRAWAVAKAAR